MHFGVQISKLILTIKEESSNSCFIEHIFVCLLQVSDGCGMSFNPLCLKKNEYEAMAQNNPMQQTHKNMFKNASLDEILYVQLPYS
jgi:hypothetical protein